jgi:hypothetical protein
MPVGTPWVERIKSELARCDFLVILLSEQSIQSEMVRAEIETAHRLAAERNGRPAILPVRLAYRDPFPYPLNVYLDPLNWASWQSAEDTGKLIEELKRAIAGGAFAASTKGTGKTQKLSDKITSNNFKASDQVSSAIAKLESPEGTMGSDSPFYIVRDTDAVALEAIKRQGVTITIKGPRQMGKSSLLIRVLEAAQKEGKRTALLDFQLFDKSCLTNADTFFRQFCALLTDELEMTPRLEEFWSAPLGNSQRSSRYMERYILKELGKPLVLLMDEVESIFDSDFLSDFFSMLRNWHNSRATKPAWKKFDLVLVTSTEPYQLVANLNQSPFNVGEVVELADFTPEQVEDLNRRHGSPLNGNAVQQLMGLLNGHPYLVRRALYLVASKRLAPAELFAKAASEHGPFGDHLRYHLYRLSGKNDLIEGLKSIIRHQTCPDTHLFFRLRGAGLVKKENNVEMPRCRLYADYFRENLNG